MVSLGFAPLFVFGCQSVLAQEPEEIEPFGVTADSMVGVEMSETNCNVTLMPTGEGWNMSRIVPGHVGATCWVGDEAVRWRHHNELDYGKTLYLVVEGRHSVTDETARALVTLTMEAAPKE